MNSIQSETLHWQKIFGYIRYGFDTDPLILRLLAEYPYFDASFGILVLIFPDRDSRVGNLRIPRISGREEGNETRKRKKAVRDMISTNSTVLEMISFWWRTLAGSRGTLSSELPHLWGKGYVHANFCSSIFDGCLGGGMSADSLAPLTSPALLGHCNL